MTQSGHSEMTQSDIRMPPMDKKEPRPGEENMSRGLSSSSGTSQFRFLLGVKTSNALHCVQPANILLPADRNIRTLAR